MFFDHLSSNRSSFEAVALHHIGLISGEIYHIAAPDGWLLGSFHLCIDLEEYEKLRRGLMAVFEEEEQIAFAEKEATRLLSQAL
jgi:hypothetical protein